MPNPTGKNGYGVKNYPPDDEFKATLMKYSLCGMTYKKQLIQLKKDHNLEIGKDKLRQHLRRLNIPSVRKSVSHEQAVEQVIEVVQKDKYQNNGPNFVKEILKHKQVYLPRRVVRNIMHYYFPEGFEKRFPGNKKRKVERQALTAIGPFHEVSGDGHEKLAALALRIGDVGFPIYGFKDKWSDYLCMLRVLPNCRKADAMGHLFLDFVSELKGIPIQMTTDKGSETGWMYGIQVALREQFAPDIDSDIFPEYKALQSIHNTVIEAFWRWLKEKLGLNVKDAILQGAEMYSFNSHNPIQLNVFNWVFFPLVQSLLDEFRNYWNYHRIRYQKEKLLPSSIVPAQLIDAPELYGGMNCLIPVPQYAIDEMRDALTEEVGPRESHLSWVSPEFDAAAQDAFTTLGLPPITLESSWVVYAGLVEYFTNNL